MPPKAPKLQGAGGPSTGKPKLRPNLPKIPPKLPAKSSGASSPKTSRAASPAPRASSPTGRDLPRGPPKSPERRRRSPEAPGPKTTPKHPPAALLAKARPPHSAPPPSDDSAPTTGRSTPRPPRVLPRAPDSSPQTHAPAKPPSRQSREHSRERQASPREPSHDRETQTDAYQRHPLPEEARTPPRATSSNALQASGSRRSTAMMTSPPERTESPTSVPAQPPARHASQAPAVPPPPPQSRPIPSQQRESFRRAGPSPAPAQQHHVGPIVRIGNGQSPVRQGDGNSPTRATDDCLVVASITIAGANYASYEHARRQGDTAIQQFEATLRDDVADVVQDASPFGRYHVSVTVGPGAVRFVEVRFPSSPPPSTAEARPVTSDGMQGTEEKSDDTAAMAVYARPASATSNDKPVIEDAEWPLRADCVVTGLQGPADADIVRLALERHLAARNALRGAFVYARAALRRVLCARASALAVDDTDTFVRIFNSTAAERRGGVPNSPASGTVTEAVEIPEVVSDPGSSASQAHNEHQDENRAQSVVVDGHRSSAATPPPEEEESASASTPQPARREREQTLAPNKPVSRPVSATPSVTRVVAMPRSNTIAVTAAFRSIHFARYANDAEARRGLLDAVVRDLRSAGMVELEWDVGSATMRPMGEVAPGTAVDVKLHGTPRLGDYDQRRAAVDAAVPALRQYLLAVSSRFPSLRMAHCDRFGGTYDAAGAIDYTLTTVQGVPLRQALSSSSAMTPHQSTPPPRSSGQQGRLLELRDTSGFMDIDDDTDAAAPQPTHRHQDPVSSAAGASTGTPAHRVNPHSRDQYLPTAGLTPSASSSLPRRDTATHQPQQASRPVQRTVSQRSEAPAAAATYEFADVVPVDDSYEEADPPTKGTTVRRQPGEPRPRQQPEREPAKQPDEMATPSHDDPSAAKPAPAVVIDDTANEPAQPQQPPQADDEHLVKDLRPSAVLQQKEEPAVVIEESPDTCLRLSFVVRGFSFERFSSAQPAMLEKAVSDEAHAVVAPYITSESSLRIYYADGSATLDDDEAFLDELGIVVDADINASDSDSLIADWERCLRDPRAFAGLRAFIQVPRAEPMVAEGEWKAEVYAPDGSTVVAVSALHEPSTRHDAAGLRSQQSGRNDVDDASASMPPATPIDSADDGVGGDVSEPPMDDGAAADNFGAAPQSTTMRFGVLLDDIDGAVFMDRADQDAGFDDNAHRAAVRDLFDACNVGDFSVVQRRDIGVRLNSHRYSGRETVEADCEVDCPPAQAGALRRRLEDWLAGPLAFENLKLHCAEHLQGVAFVEGVKAHLVNWD